MLDTLAAASVASLAVGIAYVMLFPPELDIAMRSVDSRDLVAYLRDNAQTAHEWSVKARTANYFSNVTLPILRKAALDEGRGCKIIIEVLDPDNDRLMAAYAKYRSNHQGEATKWSVERVRSEIYAAILQAALCAKEAPRLDIRIGLSPAFWVVSLDIFNDKILMTGQNKGESGLLIEKSSQHYAAWCDDFEASFSECRELGIDCESINRDSLANMTSETENMIRSFFEANDLKKCSGPKEIAHVVQTLTAGHHYGG